MKKRRPAWSWLQWGSIKCKHIVRWQHLSQIKARLFWLVENVFFQMKTILAIAETSSENYKLMEPHYINCDCSRGQVEVLASCTGRRVFPKQRWLPFREHDVVIDLSHPSLPSITNGNAWRLDKNLPPILEAAVRLMVGPAVVVDVVVVSFLPDSESWGRQCTIVTNARKINGLMFCVCKKCH